MPSYFKSISGLITSSVRHLAGTEEEKTQDKNGKINYCLAAESPYATLRKLRFVTITFDKNGGTGEMESQKIYSGIYTLPGCDFTPPSEKVFGGWSFTASGTAIPQEKVEIKTDTTLFAVWVPKKYKISFDPNSGYGPSGSGTMKTVELPNPIQKPECTFDPADGYIFKNWAKNYSSTGKPTMIRSWPQTVTGDTTYYAMWDKLYAVTFNPNGGSGTQVPIISPPAIVTLPPASKVTLIPPSKDHKFVGWSTDPTGVEPCIEEVTISEEDIELYAIWKYVDPNYLYVTYLPNGGEGELMPVHMVGKGVGGIGFIKYKECTYTKQGKVFNGWNEDPSATSGWMPETQSVISSDKTFYATWI